METSDSQHRIAAGAVVLQSGSLLVVQNARTGYWGLPKGTPLSSEPLIQAARRETMEETGLEVRIRSVAFATEFRMSGRDHYVQMYFKAEPHGNALSPVDPDGEISDVRYVPVRDLRQYIRFKPIIIPLEGWLEDQKVSYHFFDLNGVSPEVGPLAP